ncbi:SPOSA6832_03925 [Sporobolomyces salmonicolor]|uniref:SPOSA6832_03925-mRNA-1:cds n=1 Tax=Sporidiobolus salmonicolor TaxID=5005 RepID=A0A0D6EPY0_SPOSA|nr:SPOSA6832_03925 [Sporobolomyces salmonicolor]
MAPSPDPANKRQKNAHHHSDKNHTPDEFPHILPYENPDESFEPKSAVKFEVSCDPVASVCCHCHTCQVVHGATSQRAVLFHKNTVRFSAESVDALAFYQTHDHVPHPRLRSGTREAFAALFEKVPPDLFVSSFASGTQKVGRHQPCKLRCKTCGTLIADEGRNMWLAFPSLFVFEDHKEPEHWAPTDHIFYAQRVLDLERKAGVSFWEGAKDESAKL